MNHGHAEQFYRALIENSSDMMVRLTLGGVRLSVSSAARTMLGYEPAELVGRKVVDAAHPDDRARVEEAIRSLGEQTSRVRIVYRIRHRNGSYVWADSSLWRAPSGWSAVPEIHCALRDVTRQRQTEEALREQRTLLQALFDASPDAIFVFRLGPDGVLRLESTNAAAVANGSLPADGVLAGKRLDEVLPNDLAVISQGHLQRVLDTRRLVRVQAQQVVAGARVHWDIEHVPVLDSSGAVERVFVSIRDITHLRAAEAATAEANQWLTMAEQTSGVGHWRVELPSGHMFWSPEIYRIHGRKPDPAVTLDLDLLINTLHPDDRAWATDLFGTVARTGAAFQHSCRVIRLDGTIRHVMARGTRMLDAQGQPQCVFGVLVDVTEQLQTERELREAREAAEAANRTLDALAHQDSLTGLANRRRFDAVLQMAFEASCAGGEPLSLIMIDVDRFKQFNDAYGHLAGDDALRAVGAAVKSCLRQETDIGARYGGEELAVLLQRTSLPQALRIAERIRGEVEAMALPHAGMAGGVLTISAGAASCGADNPPGNQRALLLRADQALYAAKSQGRNRVCAAAAAAAATAMAAVTAR